MIETFHIKPEGIPKEKCDNCGKENTTQLYSITLERPNVTRDWAFCSMPCLRKWAAPIH